MPVVLPNVVIWTERPLYAASTGTSAPTPYLSEIEAHQGPVPQSDYVTLPASAVESQYKFKVEIGADINKGHVISKVCLNDPPLFTPWDVLGGNETLLVAFARDSSAGPLQHRQLFCQRVTAGGTSA